MRRKRLIGQNTPLELACTSRWDEFPFNRQSPATLQLRYLELVSCSGSCQIPGYRPDYRELSCRTGVRHVASFIASARQLNLMFGELNESETSCGRLALGLFAPS